MRAYLVVEGLLDTLPRCQQGRWVLIAGLAVSFALSKNCAQSLSYRWVAAKGHRFRNSASVVGAATVPAAVVGGAVDTHPRGPRRAALPPHRRVGEASLPPNSSHTRP